MAENDAKSNSVNGTNGFTAAEEKDIYRQIDDMVADSRSPVPPEGFTFQPERNDILIPAVVNAAAVVLIIAGTLLLSLFFNLRERTLVRESAQILSAEGRLLAAVREESRAQLQVKEEQIADMQADLSVAIQDRDRLQSENDVKLQQRESELQAQLERTLEQERQKLSDQGLSARQIEQQTTELKLSLQLESEAQLDKLRSRLQAELAQKQAAMNVRISEYEQFLQQAQREQGRLQELLQQREAELTDTYQQKTAALATERADITAQLSSLKNERDQEAFVFDRILAAYASVESRINSEQFDRALQELATLEIFLQQDEIASLSAVERRQAVERFVINTLKESINRQLRFEIQRQTLTQYEELFTSVKQTIQNADRLRQAEDPRARNAYEQAIGLIPEINRSYRALSNMNREEQEQERTQQAEALKSLQEKISLLEADLSAERGKARGAAAERGRQQALAAQLTAVRSHFENGIRSRPADHVPTQEEMLTLLETKLLIKQIISTEPVKSDYPQLYDQMERYFDTFGAEQVRQGQITVLQDMLAVVDAILLEQDPGRLGQRWAHYGSQDERSGFRQLLEKLGRLLK